MSTILGCWQQTVHGALHRQQRCLQDIDGVDLCDLALATDQASAFSRISSNSRSRRAAVKRFESRSPSSGLFGIQYDGGGNHRSGQRTTTGLVNTGNPTLRHR